MYPTGTAWMLPTDRFYKRQAWEAIRHARKLGYRVGMILLESLGKKRDPLLASDVVFYVWPYTSKTGYVAVIGRGRA